LYRENLGKLDSHKRNEAPLQGSRARNVPTHSPGVCSAFAVGACLGIGASRPGVSRPEAGVRYGVRPAQVLNDTPAGWGAGRGTRPWTRKEPQPPTQPEPRGSCAPHCVPRSRVSPGPRRNLLKIKVSPHFGSWWKAPPTGPAVGRCYPAFANRAPRRPVPKTWPADPSS